MSEQNLSEALQQLSELKNSGALTEEEYAAAKAKLLNSREAVVPEIIDEKYSENYSEESFWDKITSTVKKAGAGLIYKALQLFYATQNPNCPIAVKTAIFGALGYFILPLDLIPDFIPGVGFGDDLAAITAAIAMAHLYIDENVIMKAKNQMQELFGKNILKELE